MMKQGHLFETGRMLEYKITCADLIISMFRDPLLLGVTAIVYFALGICLFRVGDKRTQIIILTILIALPVLYVSPTLTKTLSDWDWYGYEIQGDKLHIRAWPADEVTDLKNSTVFLTKSKEWRPKLRTFGTGMMEVGMGYFRLENGIEAVVFRHKNSENMLVINTSGKHYVIIHPGVEKTYEEIIRIKKS